MANIVDFQNNLLKFIYSDKATKFEKISHYSILEFLKFNIAF